MFRTFSFKKFDYLLVALVVCLNYCGLLAVRNAAPELYGKQQIGLGLGIVLMLLISVVDYHFVLKFHWVAYALSIALLVLVLFSGSTGVLR